MQSSATAVRCMVAKWLGKNRHGQQHHKLLLVELLHIILGIVLWPVYQGTYCIVGKSTVTALN